MNDECEHGLGGIILAHYDDFKLVWCRKCGQVQMDFAQYIEMHTSEDERQIYRQVWKEIVECPNL